jgi:hypothetical protein
VKLTKTNKIIIHQKSICDKFVTTASKTKEALHAFCPFGNTEQFKPPTAQGADDEASFPQVLRGLISFVPAGL